MCWSKRSQEEEHSRPRTTSKPMTSKSKCAEGRIECSKEQDENSNYCSGYGQCCYDPKLDKNDTHYRSCVCDEGRKGHNCEDTDWLEMSKDFQRTTALAAFSAVLGVIVITFFVALIVLQIKYYRRRKIRRHLAGDDHELNRISRPDASAKGSKRRLTTQPGYSWRESVRRTHSKASKKFRSTLSRSVPDDLFQVDLKLAIFEGCQPNLSPTVGKAEVKAVTTQRCFSAGPDLGDGQTTCELKDNTNGSNRPIVVQMPLTAAATRTEDTVK